MGVMCDKNKNKKRKTKLSFRFFKQVQWWVSEWHGQITTSYEDRLEWQEVGRLEDQQGSRYNSELSSLKQVVVVETEWKG